MLNDTNTDTFIRYQIFSIPIPVLFSIPNFLDTGSETFFRYSILPIPVPRLFAGTNFSDTGSDTTSNRKNSRFRYLFGSDTHYKPSKFLNFGEENHFWNQIFTNIFFRYQIFSIPIPVLFSGTKFFRYRFRDFFPVPIFSDTGSNTTKKMKNSRYREFPVPVRHTLLET